MSDDNAAQADNPMIALARALAAIQQAIKAPKLRHNKFGDFDFRKCEDILQAVKPLLGEHVILLDDDIVMIGDRYYVKATAAFSDGYSAICRSSWARESDSKKGMDDAMVTGSASSYARKAALSGLLLLDDNRDVDEQVTETIQRITPDQVAELDKLLTDTGSDKAKFLKYVQADKLEDIQAAAFDDAVTMIKSAERRRKLESMLADLREEVAASDLGTALAALDASDLDDKGKASIRKQLQAEMPA